MPITFPHFGSLTYVFESLVKELGRTDVILPKPPSRKTAQLGARYGPEYICTPFKMTLGTFIESLEKGADELAIGGCQAYCRFGYYWPVQKLILEDLGYKFRFIHIDYDHPLEILRTLKKEISNNYSYAQTLRAARITWLKNRLTDLVDELLYKYRALEVEKGLAERVAHKCYRKIVALEGAKAIRKYQKILPDIFVSEIEIRNESNPLRVMINGEIYVVLEPSLNVNVHKRMNELGVVTKSPTTLRRFYDLGQKWNPFKLMDYKIADKMAKPYIAHRCGGEAQEAIGETIIYKKQGFDGVIHLYPFTCLPHIASKNILPQISRLYDIPVLSLVVDEQTGEAGFQTRLEAFVDLLARKRKYPSRKGKDLMPETMQNNPVSLVK
ncbi:MAG: CoA protein activase [Promethearchaeia archaeon]|nr:MAG: CoA protein activase [Candidatus Lokiarchaeia archaeon]